MIVSKDKANFALCELNPTARGNKNKWIPRHWLLVDGLNGPDIAKEAVSKGLCTEREIKRNHVRLLPKTLLDQKSYLTVLVDTE